MDSRNYANQKVQSLEAVYPTFPHAMPMTKKSEFFEGLLLLSTIENLQHWKGAAHDRIVYSIHSTLHLLTHAIPLSPLPFSIPMMNHCFVNHFNEYSFNIQLFMTPYLSIFPFLLFAPKSQAFQNREQSRGILCQLTVPRDLIRLHRTYMYHEMRPSRRSHRSQRNVCPEIVGDEQIDNGDHEEDEEEDHEEEEEKEVGKKSIDVEEMKDSGFLDHQTYGDQGGAHRRSKETCMFLCVVLQENNSVMECIQLMMVPYMHHLMILDHRILELSDLKLGV
ncbi:hypothetical protein YC2023_042047 [Brassica napus]